MIFHSRLIVEPLMLVGSSAGPFPTSFFSKFIFLSEKNLQCMRKFKKFLEKVAEGRNGGGGGWFNLW